MQERIDSQQLEYGESEGRNMYTLNIYNADTTQVKVCTLFPTIALATQAMRKWAGENICSEMDEDGMEWQVLFPLTYEVVAMVTIEREALT